MNAAPGLAANFALYVSAVFAIGWLASRRTHGPADYFLGGRTLGPKVAALSAGASDMSGWLLIGLPGYAYVSGVEAFWLAGGLCAGVAFAWLFVARRLRAYSIELNDALTLPTYLERRFALAGPWLRIASAVSILLFFLFYVCSGLVGSGKLFSTTFGWDYQLAVFIGAAVVVAYTLLGGFLAVSWTDVLQGVLMTVALIVVPWVVFQTASAPVQTLTNEYAHLLNPWTDAEGIPLGWIAIASLVGWGLAYPGQPHILARFKAVRDDALVSRAAAIAIAWSLIVYVCAVVAGLSGVIGIAQPLEDPERVFMVLVQTLFHPVVAGLLLAAILAAIMSTVDSQLLVSAAALAEDLLGLLGRRLSAASRLRVGRAATFGLGLVAMVIALNPESSVLAIVGFAWGGLGASLGPAVLLSLYWPRMTGSGALAGVVVGGLTVVVWSRLSGGIYELYELVPGFVFSTLAIVIVSLLSPPPSATVRAGFARAVGNRAHGDAA